MTAGAFVTPDGVHVPAVTAEQMRAVDRVAVEETGPNLYQMMENAGRSLAVTALEMLGRDWSSASIVVLAGTGGNGGGGICAARHLANRGADVTVVLTSAEGLGPAPAAQLAIYRHTSGRLSPPDGLEGLDAALIVDSVIGYGLTEAPHGAALSLIRWAAATSAAVVSLDVPSGIESTIGTAPGAHITADRTLTLALPKTGLDHPGVGDLWLTDIGIPTEVYRRVGIDVPSGLFGPEYRARLAPA